MIREVAVGLLATGGTFFMFTAALGVLRFPDAFMRLHASTKGASLGLTLLLAASAVHFGGLIVPVITAVAVVFTFVTTPVGAHAVARWAYHADAPLWERTHHDALADAPDRRDAEGEE